MSELLNCPLCDEPACWHAGSDNENNTGVGCKFCGLDLWEQGPGCMDRAAAKWNRRPHPAPVGFRVPEEKQRPYTDPINVSEAAVNTYTTGWNDCRSEVLRLNPQPGAVVGDTHQAARNIMLAEADRDASTLTNTDKGVGK